MSAALRAVFAEFGIKADTAKLDELDKMVRGAADHLRDATVAATNFDGVLSKAKGPKDSVDGIKAMVAEQKAANDRMKTFSGFLEAKRDDAAGRVGDSARKAVPGLQAFADRIGMSNTQLGRFVMTATAAGGALAALGVHMAFSFASQFAQSAEALRETAIESRVTTSELQGIDHAAVQAGVGVERMRAGLHTFGEALRQGERWGNGTTSTLRRLGITTRDAAGHIRPTAELLDEVAVGMERIESPFRRARVAQQLFGESGRRMLDVLHTGPGGIRALREELDELGGGVTPEAIEASRRFTQAQERQGRALDSVRSVLATALLPALSWMMNLSARLTGELAKLTRGTHVAEVGLTVLGAAGVAAAAALIAAWLPAAAPFLAVAAAVGLAVLAIDDIITFAEGGDSAIGRMIDTMFGAGTAVQTVDALRGSWAGVKDIVDQVSAAIGLMMEKIDGMRDTAAPLLSAINSARGYLPGGESIAGTQVATTLGGPSGDDGFSTGVERSAGGRRRVQIVTAPASAMQTVAAPGSVTNHRTTAHAVSRTVAPVMHFYGVTDARQIAALAAQEIRREDAQMRDADHPTEDAD